MFRSFCGLVVAGAVCVSVARAGVPASPSLLPNTTKGWVSTSDINELSDQFDRTNYGQLLSDKKMEKFVEHFRNTWRDRRSKKGGGLEFSWEVLRKISGGEVAFALVDPGKALKPSQVMLVDVTGHVPAAQAELQRIETDLQKQGAVKQEVKADGATLVQLRQNQETRLLYFLADNLVCATDNVELAKGILGRLRQPSDECLARLKPFVDVADRLAEDDKVESAPTHLRWFIKPIEFIEARRKVVNYEPQKRDLLQTFKKTGFLAVQGIGGNFSFGGKQHDILSRTAVATAPRDQWKDSMHVLSFYNAPVTPAAQQTWVVKPLATYTSFNIDTLSSFEHLGPFFDSRVGGGRQTWNATLETIRDAKKSAQVDIRGEIVENLTNHAVVMTDHREPIETESERRLMAVAIKPGKEDFVRERLNRVCEFEKYIPHTIEGVTVWEITQPAERKPKDQKNTEAPKPKRSSEFNLKDEQKTGASDNVNVRVPRPEVKPEEPGAICVAHGQVFYANRITLLIKVVKQGNVAGKDDTMTLKRDDNYQYVMGQIDGEMKKRNWDDVSLRRYDDSQEEIRGSYLLAKEGKLSESQGLVARLLRSAASDNSDPDEPPLIDGKLLPDFAGFAREKFKPAGLLMRTDERGWFIVSFTLRE